MQERYTVPVPGAARVRGRAVPGVRQPELRREEGEGGDGHAHPGGQQHRPEGGRGHVSDSQYGTFINGVR